MSRRVFFPDGATLAAYRFGALVARTLPASVSRAVAPIAGSGASFASAPRRDMIERHLRRVDPTLDRRRLRRRVDRAFDSYANYWLESFRLPHVSADDVRANMAVDGFEHIEQGLAGGNGVILALPHLGGWEWAGRWLADQGLGVTAVVEAIEPPELFDWFRDLRNKLGMNIVSLGPSAGRQVSAALARNDIVCLLCDRDIQRSGVEVEFFGEATTLPAGPATLALRSGAPVLPTSVMFTGDGDGHLAIVRPPLAAERTRARLRVDVQRITQALAVELEGLIRRAPEQWHLFQPNWPSDPGYHLRAGSGARSADVGTER